MSCDYLQVIDKAITLMPDTSRDLEEDLEDQDSGINIRFQATEQRGLSELVRQCFGKPLNKGEQMSDWEKRPLRTTQVQYAGKHLDIYIKQVYCTLGNVGWYYFILAH